MILVRVMVAKIPEPTALAQKLREVKVNNDDPSWNCVTWVKEALAAIKQEKKTLVGTCNLS